MINLNQGDNLIITTLKEKSINLQLPLYYTWKLYNKDSHKEYILSCDDLSNSPYYDSFSFSIGSINSPTGSVAQFIADQGTFEYKVYQMPSQYNLNITSTSSQIETGILTITGTSSNLISFTQSDDCIIKIYKHI